MSGPTDRRGQANLAALAVALGVLLSVTVFALAVADSTLAGQQQSSEQRRVAVSLSDRLVEPGSPLATRPNVLNATAVETVAPAELERTYPAVDRHDVTITVAGRPLIEGASGGEPVTTIRRLVVIERVQQRTMTPSFSGSSSVTLPRRSGRVRLALAPDTARIERVRANGRVVLENESGLRGTFSVSLSRRETVTLQFVANRSLSRGDVTVTTFPAATTKAQLVVRVDV